MISGGKTGARQGLPLPKAWIDRWDLQTKRLPGINLDRDHRTVGSQLGVALRRHGAPFLPYDLRHAWAVRAIHNPQISPSLAAKSLGHSLMVHTSLYQRWFDSDSYNAYVGQAIDGETGTDGENTSLRTQRFAQLCDSLRERKLRFFLIAIGQDDPKPFLLQIKALGLSDQVQILKGRSDIPRFLLGADLLIHPAYNENTGTVLLEAVVAGLPVLVSAVCGYAHYIAEADAGLVLDEPFEQEQLNRYLQRMLEDDAARADWGRNGLAFADTADLYSMPQHAADVILAQERA